MPRSNRWPERIFSVAHTGGDLSTPESVRSSIQPAPFPVVGAEPQAPPGSA